MRGRGLSGKLSHSEHKNKHRSGPILAVCLQHALLWMSLYIFSATIYEIVSTRARDETILVPDVITVGTVRLLPWRSVFVLIRSKGSISISYIVFHNAAAYLSRAARTEHKNRARVKLQWLTKITLRMTLTLWLASSGLNLTFTVAPHPQCSRTTAMGLSVVDFGTNCILQRSIIGTSLLAL